MWNDLRLALRTLRHSPTFTLAVTLSLGLALGANATMFGVADAMWLRPPGVADARLLARVFATTPTSTTGPWSFPEYRDLRERMTTVAGVVARGRRGAMLRLPDGTSELELANVVSTNFFELLGIDAAVGRVFTPADDAWLERNPVVILGHAFWARRYGGERSIVGRTITLGRETPVTVTVLGVLPPSFRDLDPATDRDLWMPPATWRLLANASEFEQRDYRWFELFARRKPNVAVQQADAELAQLARAFAAGYPEISRGRGARLVPDLTYRLEVGGVNAFALLGLVALVALITCVNIANLLLARGAERAREMAVRVSLGARRTQLLRQLMLESAWLGALGTAAGLLVAAALVLVLPAIVGAPPGLRSFVVFAADLRVLLFTSLTALVTTIAFGLLPSWLATRPDVVPLLKGETGWAGLLAGHHKLRVALTVTQVAVAIVVVCSAALLWRSFDKSSRQDLGFTRQPIVAAWITFADAARPTMLAAIERVRAVPGVADVAVAIRAPLSLSGGGRAARVFVPGTDAGHAGGVPEIKFNAVSANFFDVMGVPLRAGRSFEPGDDGDGPRVMVVSDRFARQLFPGGGALGQVVKIGGPAGVDHEIVGIVSDTAINAVDEEREPYFYVPFWRARYGEFTLLIDAPNGAAIAAPVRTALRAFDARFEPRNLVTLQELVEYSQSSYRATAFLAGAVAIVGLILTALGVYGLVSLNAVSRTREMGIRLALGADRSTVLRLIMTSGGRLALAGVAVGVPVALMITRLLSSLLFDVRPWDVPAFVAGVGVVVISVLLATAIPARRISRVPPSDALRQ